MEKNAIIHVENTENLLEFASYLSHSGWNILSADKTEDFLLKERIPVIHESLECVPLVKNLLFCQLKEYSNLNVINMKQTPKGFRCFQHE